MGVLAVLILPLLVVGISGIVYIYRTVVHLMSKSAVRSKVVVITDALSGAGKDAAGGVHKDTEPDKVPLPCIHRIVGEQISAFAGASARTFTPKLVLLDLSDINCIQDVAKEILDCYGCVDILINNASMKVKGTVQNISLELDKKIMDANYFGPITLTKALIPNMISRRTGQVVLLNNIQGKLGVPFRAAYAASKHAALGFFDCLRAELQEFGVCVSTVTPSFICSYHVQPQPSNWEASVWKFFSRKLANGVHPVEVAEEILRTVSRKKQEVFLANPIAKAAVYIRTFFPELFFAVVAAGVKEKQKIVDDK
ncbi:dehydrogenase/reductase SDR family member 7C [Varanus komodoensis]|uniref:dehydrogenase/reductase SDR family member 7C n=1 Tax=Varanus komodoensis TaxID=61221 RepID=UPI001CF78F46|nr:dehydrogenase/reductase SDR family member 7C [Varanus komodoensis]